MLAIWTWDAALAPTRGGSLLMGGRKKTSQLLTSPLNFGFFLPHTHESLFVHQTSKQNKQRNYGLKLYQDASFLNIHTLFGDVTSDPELVKSVIANGPLAHVWTGAVLHVLDQAKVEALLRTVFTMLRPGGTYFGTCAGSTDKPKEWLPEYRNRGQAYLHSPKSLKELLEQIGFDEVVVENLDHSLPSEESQHSAPMAFLGFTAKKPA
jgi:hypothetical protein